MREVDKNYSYIRNNSYLHKNGVRRNGINGAKKIDKSIMEKIANQFIVSAAIALIVIVVSNFNFSITNKIVESVKWAAFNDYDFKSGATNLKENVLPAINSKIKSITGGLNENSEEL